MKKQKEIKFDHFAIATEDLEQTVIIDNSGYSFAY